MLWNVCQLRANFFTDHASDVIIAIFYYVWGPTSTIVITRLFLENSFVFLIRQKMLWKNIAIAKKLTRLKMRKIGNIPNYYIGPTRIGELPNLMSIVYGIEMQTNFEVSLTKSYFRQLNSTSGSQIDFWRTHKSRQMPINSFWKLATGIHRNGNSFWFLENLHETKVPIL